MRTVGIKLADGSFYPIMEEGSAQKKTLELTTAHNNQTCVMVDLYRSKNCTMEDAEYIDTLKIENLVEHPNGEPSISFDVDLDENGELSYSIADPETGTSSNSEITLVSRTVEERLQADDYSIEETSGNGAAVAAGVVAGAGLMAAAAAIASNKKDDEEDQAVEEDATVAEDDFTLGDPGADSAVDEFDVPEDTTIADDDAAIAEDDATVAGDSLPDFDETTITDEPPAESADTFEEDDSLPDFEETTVEDDATVAEDDTIVTDDSLPDFEETPVEDDATVAEDDTTQTEDFSIPDGLTENPDFSESSGFADAPARDPLFSDETISDDDTFSTAGMDFDEPDPAPAPAAGGMDFSGLYDKETEMGNASENQEDDFKKKTRAPVIICIICAIICLVATALVLLILPTKFNLRLKHSQKKQETVVEKPAETPATQTPAPEKQPDPVPQAKEDEIVVIEKAEEVKPLPPPAPETKPAGVTYKIKWGDTLWDIADTYYKNPWRYKKIANYNGIKNPDHIISGTVITIPAE